MYEIICNEILFFHCSPTENSMYTYRQPIDSRNPTILGNTRSWLLIERSGRTIKQHPRRFPSAKIFEWTISIPPRPRLIDAFSPTYIHSDAFPPGTSKCCAAFPEIRDLFLLAERRQGICQNYESLGRASYETPRIANWKKYIRFRVNIAASSVLCRYSFFFSFFFFFFWTRPKTRVLFSDVGRLLHRGVRSETIEQRISVDVSKICSSRFSRPRLSGFKKGGYSVKETLDDRRYVSLIVCFIMCCNCYTCCRNFSIVKYYNYYGSFVCYV